jgi:predicted transcriptional regulator of viral defense system
MKLTTRLKDYVDAAGLTEFSRLDSLSLTSENALRVTLNRLVSAGEIYNPVRGVYVSRNADPFFVACTLYPGYVSLSSALYLHHLTEEYPFTIFVASDVRKSVRMGDHMFLYFKARDYRGVEGKEYQVASVEKAICDSFRHQGMVDYMALEKALYAANLKAGKFLRLCGGESSAFFQRLGYLLSILPKRDSEKTKLLEYCRKRIKANAYLRGRKHGIYIREWRIIDNIGKEVLLSWWLQ